MNSYYGSPRVSGLIVLSFFVEDVEEHCEENCVQSAPVLGSHAEMDFSGRPDVVAVQQSAPVIINSHAVALVLEYGELELMVPVEQSAPIDSHAVRSEFSMVVRPKLEGGHLMPVQETGQNKEQSCFVTMGRKLRLRISPRSEEESSLPLSGSDESIQHREPITIWSNDSLTCSFQINSTTIYRTVSWSVAGFRLYLPTGPISNEFDGKLITIKTVIDGSYHFPPNTKPVSAIYSILADFSIEATIELKHCYRGDLQALAFVYCDCDCPPFHFLIVNEQEYKYSFTASHGVIKTHHFSCWGIVEMLKGSVNQFLGYNLLPTNDHDSNSDEGDSKTDDHNSNEEINVLVFFQVKASIMNVDLVVVKGLPPHIEVWYTLGFLHVRLRSLTL